MVPREPPGELLERGRRVLDPLLSELGFRFRFVQNGKGSGGHFVVGRYESIDRAIEVHVRYDLGIVNYSIGAHELSHLDLARCFEVPREDLAYPGFSDDPVEGFVHLRADLKGPLNAFFDGSRDESFARCARRGFQHGTRRLP